MHSFILAEDKSSEFIDKILVDLLQVPDRWISEVEKLSPQVFVPYIILGDCLALGHEKFTCDIVSYRPSIILSILMMVEIADSDHLAQVVVPVDRVLPYALFCLELVKPIPGDFSSSLKTTVTEALSTYIDAHLNHKSKFFYQKILENLSIK